MGVALGRYVLDRKIAVGGMGEVYLARQTGPDGFERVCVVKKMHEALATAPEFVDLFLEEARLSSKLTHPHIAQIYDFGKEGDTYYLAMEYVNGPSVREIIRGHRQRHRVMELGVALRIGAQAAQALDYVHRVKGPDGASLKLVHRDVSPANLLVSSDGLVKVIDFGIAKARTTVREQTQAGVVRGKLAYVAPEQMASLPVDGRADIFSLGMVVYELVSLQRALRGATDAELVESAAAWNIEPLSKVRPDCPPAVAEVVERAIAHDPGDRYQTASDFADALEVALARAHLVVPPSYLKTLAIEFASVPRGDGAAQTPSGRDDASPALKATPSRPSAPRVAAAKASGPRPPPASKADFSSTDNATTSPAIPRAVATVLSPAHKVGNQPARAEAPRPTPDVEQNRSRVGGNSGPAPIAQPPVAPAVAPLQAAERSAEPTAEPTAGSSAEPTALLASEPAPERTIIAARPGPPREEWPAVTVVAGLAVLLLVGAITIWWALRGDDRRAPAVRPAVPMALLTGVDAGAAVAVVAAAPESEATLLPEEAVDGPPAGDEVAPEVEDAGPRNASVPLVLGVLEVTSQPPLDVWVDGRPQGTAPRTLKVRVGPHRVTWRSKALGLSRTVAVRIAEREPTRLDWRPQEGTVEVRAVPPQVELQITLDGKAVGVTPLAALRVWEGAHLVGVRNAETGWKAQQKVVVPPDGKLRLKVNDGAGITVSEK